MDATERAIHRGIRATIRDNAFYDILKPWGCGAFDGGCLIVATALYQLMGGSPIVTRRALYDGLHSANQQHAMVGWCGWLVDGDGLTRPASFVARWKRQELVRDPRLACVTAWNIPEAAYSQEAVKQVAALFQHHVQLPVQWSGLRSGLES